AGAALQAAQARLRQRAHRRALPHRAHQLLPRPRREAPPLMRSISLILQCSMVLALAAPARGDDPAADPDAPTVGASLDRTEAHVGDRLTLTVTAIARDAVAPTVR